MIKLPAKLPVTLPTLPVHSLDITGWDMSRLDPRRFLRRPDLAGLVTESPVARVAARTLGQTRDVALTAVGFGVLAGQKIQVRRRELFDAIAAQRRHPDPATDAADTTDTADDEA